MFGKNSLMIDNRDVAHAAIMRGNQDKGNVTGLFIGGCMIVAGLVFLAIIVL